MSYEYGFVIARIWLSARLQDVCVYIYKYVYLYIYIYYIIITYAHTYIHLPIYIYCVFLYRSYNNTNIYIQRTHMYMYIYIYRYVHTHIYILYIYPLVCSACPDLRSLASESVFFTWRHSRALFVSRNLEQSKQGCLFFSLLCEQHEIQL